MGIFEPSGVIQTELRALVTSVTLTRWRDW